MNKKLFLSLSILLLAFASSSAHAWWFFFLPGSVTSAIGDALTGSEGANCVRATTSVGDKVKMPDGSVGVIKSLSGTSSRCRDPATPIRALIVPASEYAPSSYTPPVGSTPPDSSPRIETPKEYIPSGLNGVDSKVGFDLPVGWNPDELTDELKIKGYLYSASYKSIDSHLLISAGKREGIADMVEFVKDRRAALMNNLIDARPSDIEAIQILGMPAWRFDVTGNSRATKDYWAYLTTIVDTGSELVELRAWTYANWFSTRRAELSRLAYSLKGLSVSPVPLAATPSTPAPPPPPEPVATPVENTAKPQGSIATRLGVLNKLYQEGLINEKDFESKKQEILKGL